jgi:CelD/BcsL family acetyltransferase involved in cellulose biosynthesis
MLMKISVVPACELDDSARSKWLALQGCNPALASPFFCPEFTLAVNDACGNVRVAILEEGGSMVGFFPFQSHWSVGGPSGRMLSDHQGVICAPGTHWQWSQLLRAAGLSCWRFDHLCADQAHGVQLKRATSPALDLSQGFAAYKAGRLATHIGSMRSYERKLRKLEREVGPLRYVDNADDPAVFDAVLRLKSEQYLRMGEFDVLKLGWVRDLLHRVVQIDLPHFAGRIAALYAGDHLAAAFLGLRSKAVWHSWFPVYVPSLGKYSPGSQLLLFIAAAAAHQGHRLLDLGRGDEPYKQIFANHSIPLLEGAFTRSTAGAAFTFGAYETARSLLSSPFGRRLRPLAQRVRGR